MSDVCIQQYPDLLREYWGFDTLRPLQAQAVACGVNARDSLVVMPTGGGKSLCFQVPPLVTGRLGIVISPLIALMKDQVDGLVMSGYPAASLNSHTRADEARDVAHRAEDGSLRLLYVAPERLFNDRFLSWLSKVGPASFAIDEAHCISAWGHDFRPEYRRLSELRARFPGASLHAFTATATPRVQEDIVEQLQLREPEIMIGRFDRPNLTYRVVPRTDVLTQVMEAVKRHETQATIVYCISRKETENLASSLRANKIYARAYHAGLDHAERRKVQDEFAQEKLNVVVATVAFGMGIDRSDVRCVLHSSHPKSVEAYQQETGRAGRDGLPAECLLLYSGVDTNKWINLIQRSAEESEVEVPAAWINHQIEHVRAMQSFCQSSRCRHAVLSEYFGQTYEPPPDSVHGCGGCDLCLGELEPDPESLDISRKIVSCVARIIAASPNPTRPIEFGATHIANVLRGRNLEAIRERGHDRLTTFGLLREMSQGRVTSYINQLVDRGALRRAPGSMPTIGMGEHARAVLKGELDPRLVRAIDSAASRKSKGADLESADPITSELFEALRVIRRSIAQEKNIPAYMIFGDRTLLVMAKRRPVTPAAMRGVPGVGDQKAREFADRFVAEIQDFCRARGIEGADQADETLARNAATEADSEPVRRNATREQLDQMWERGATPQEACEYTKLKISTVAKYLEEYIEETKPADISAWVDPKTYAAIIDAAAKTGADRLKPIFEFLGETVPYEQIRWALTHDRVTRGGAR